MISKEVFNVISKDCGRKLQELHKCYYNGKHITCEYDICPNRLNPKYRKQNPLTPEQFTREMLKLYKDYIDDEECCHIEMDHLICGLLTDLGYGDGIYIFDQTHKWYA